MTQCDVALNIMLKNVVVILELVESSFDEIGTIPYPLIDERYCIICTKLTPTFHC